MQGVLRSLTYCILHLRHCIRYTMLLVLQLAETRALILTPVTELVNSVPVLTCAQVWHRGSSTLAAPFIYYVFQWLYRRSLQKIVQTSRSSVGHQGCIQYRFLHFLWNMESRKMVSENFRQIEKFGIVCYDQWNSMCFILLTWSERCGSVHTGSPNNLFSDADSRYPRFNRGSLTSFVLSKYITSPEQIRRRLNAWLYGIEDLQFSGGNSFDGCIGECP